MTGRHRARVLLVANNFPPVRGGSAAVYDSLARHAKGEVIVIAPHVSYTTGLQVIGWREHDRTSPYRVIRLPLLRTRMDGPRPRGLQRPGFLLTDAAIRLRLILVVLALVATRRVRAVCVGELIASGWLLGIVRFVPRVRTLAYVHGEEITTVSPHDPTRQRVRRTLRDIDRVIVVSRFTQRVVQDLLCSTKRADVRLIENGVDTTRFTPAARQQEFIELYRLAGCFVFVSVCRLLEKKGIDHAIRAFATVARRHEDSRYLIVGTGEYEGALRALVAALGLDGKVIFAGSVPHGELAEHYRLGDVFVMPNRELPNGDTEGFGLVFLEANGCGLPVIAGRDGGSTDAVQHGVNGLVVDGGSVDEIAHAMLLLYEDAGLRDELRRQGMARAAGADWERKTRDFLAICLEPDQLQTSRERLSSTDP